MCLAVFLAVSTHQGAKSSFIPSRVRVYLLGIIPKTHATLATGQAFGHISIKRRGVPREPWDLAVVPWADTSAPLHYFPLVSFHTTLGWNLHSPLFLSRTKWDYKDIDLLVSVTVICRLMSSFLISLCLTTMTVWGEVNATAAKDSYTVSVDGQLRCPFFRPTTRTPTLDVGHIWSRTLFCNSLNRTHPLPCCFIGFGRPRVGRWRTSKRCSPTSVIWWRWKRANLHRRPGRARKSSCRSPGKAIYTEVVWLTCRGPDSRLFTNQRNWCFLFVCLHDVYALEMEAVLPLQPVTYCCVVTQWLQRSIHPTMYRPNGGFLIALKQGCQTQSIKKI